MLLSYEMLEESVVENCSQLINKLLGASGGLGLETTRILALRGVHVVMAVGNVKNVLMAARLMLSQNNIELQFATNHLGHFLLATLLLENY
ncbi:hypothetical protein QL285_003096 [Trifolium repens]|nr:hypothetical protein QL285_040929 [Trifolium repens]KAK2455666.1 hypothetical protein QL285_003096 [Trifolium repens]